MTEFVVSEADVALELGWSVREVQEARRVRLHEGKDFGKVGKKILYRAESVAALRAGSGGGTDGVSDDPKKTSGAASGEPEVVHLVIERLCPNPTWVMARVGGVLKKVRVRNNLLLHRGKTIAAVPVGDDFVMTGVRG